LVGIVVESGEPCRNGGARLFADTGSRLEIISDGRQYFLMLISIIVPVLNASKTLTACLQAIFKSEVGEFECLVVDDGSTDDSKQIAGKFPVKLISPGGDPHGPAYARNLGSHSAQGEYLFFVDADVLIQPDTLTRLAVNFEQHPEYAAIFGSYDELPEDTGLISQFKNLAHHHFHQTGNPEAGTFWSGCGAIRANVFREFGGFDELKYPKPSIEDIELGIRLNRAGYKIYLDKTIQVKHLKRWTLLGLIKTDVKYRGIPWTQLILQGGRLPDDLNLNPGQRISAVLSVILVLSCFLCGFYTNVLLQVVLLGLPFFVLLDWQWRSGKIYYRASALNLLGSTAYLVLFGLFAWLAGVELLIYSAIIIVGMLLGGQILTRLGMKSQSILFGVVIIGLLAAFGLQIFSGPLWLASTIILVAVLIAWLNRGLFIFFVQRRGVLIALAFYPIQIMYYLYSLAAFFVGSVLHLANSRHNLHPTRDQNKDPRS
jgi:glycosyltransferase involved in cell wall biosynthesis